VTGAGDAAALLDVRGISKRYGGIHAVRDGNLRVARAELMGLVGPNGCGKSTILGIVSGLVRPDGGSAVFDGEPLPFGKFRATQRRGLVIVPQEIALAPLDRVWESVVLGAEPTKRGTINRRRAKRIAAEALAMLGHELPLDARVASLSPVERRLVTIARGAARSNVRLLILDEPTAGLPGEEAARVVDAMRKLVTVDRSLVLVSHHIEDVVSACQKVTLMRDGVTYRTLVGDEINKDGIVKLLLANTDTTASAGSDHDASHLGDDVAWLSNVTGEFLRRVSFQVRRGEVVGVAGTLGSGQSEIVELLSGQKQPSSGEVRIGAARVRPSAPHVALRSGVGFVSGDRASLVIRSMSVSEHVALPALRRLTRSGLLSRKHERSWVDGSLKELSVKGTPEALMTSLSGGNQQRALMARWIKLSVDVLVVDQPTVGVDLAGRAQLLGVVRNLAQQRGVVFSAEPDELAAISDRVICLRRGVIVKELTAEEATEEAILDAIS